MLSSCKEALDRFEWRYNNIIKYLLTTFSSQGLEGVEIFADLDVKANDRALPLDESDQGQPGQEELQQARPPRILTYLERQALS